MLRRARNDAVVLVDDGDGPARRQPVRLQQAREVPRPDGDVQRVHHLAPAAHRCVEQDEGLAVGGADIEIGDAVRLGAENAGIGGKDGRGGGDGQRRAEGQQGADEVLAGPVAQHDGAAFGHDRAHLVVELAQIAFEQRRCRGQRVEDAAEAREFTVQLECQVARNEDGLLLAVMA